MYKKIPIILILLIGFTILAVAGLRNGLLFYLGVLLGICFVRGKIGFTSGWRRLILYGDTGNFNRQLLFIGLAVIVFSLIFASFDTLNKTLAPISWSGVIGAVIFGIGMQLADGCGSGTLYKSGSRSGFSQVALLFFIIGNFAATLNFHNWLNLGALPAVDLSLVFTQYGAILLQLVMLGALFLVSNYWGRYRSINFKDKHRDDFLLPILLLVLVLAVINLLLTGQMWGIVYAFGLWGAKTVQFFGADLSAVPYWSQPVTIKSLEQSVFFDITTLTNLGLILGAWLTAKTTTENKQKQTPLRYKISPIIGGLLLGYGSRLGFGCNIGAFFSGIASSSLHGWVWFVFAFGGSLIGIRFRKLFGFND